MRRILLLLLGVMLLASCGRDADHRSPEKHAVYYWRTQFRLSAEERDWLQREHVSRLYLHLFDVIASTADPSGLRPEATLELVDSVPSGLEVVPVVFIDHRALQTQTEPKAVGRLILKRIDQMMTVNHLPKAAEVQIDYDWMPSTQDFYFRLLQHLADTLHADGRRLSTTIRLHQLALTAPPVDAGVLMLYNTGRFSDPAEPNSILSEQSVKPYMKHLPGYPLTLRLALPAFSWNLVFRDNEFACIAPGLPLDNPERFARQDSTHWQALTYQAIPSAGIAMGTQQRILPGDIVRRETASPALNQRLYDHMQQLRPELSSEVVLYHLEMSSMLQYPQ